jgi:ubiquinone/menaquinone biosynthesis C-methylase UbiE
MFSSIAQWHARYLQQAGWTYALRQHLFERVGLEPIDPILEVGCGTGAILTSLPARQNAFGLDIDFASLAFAQTHLSDSLPLVQGDGHALPFISRTFKVTFCHFLLLWVVEPAVVLSEMARVTRRGGAVIAFAEPDYLSRLDAPEPLKILAQHQNSSLLLQGANIEIGRNLGTIFHSTELVNIHVGSMEYRSDTTKFSADANLEWQVWKSDLMKLPNYVELEHVVKSAESVWRSPERSTFVPCSYAIGFIP